MATKPKKTGPSVDMHDKQRLEKEEGTLLRDGSDWTQSETDVLLNMFLSEVGLKTITLALQRPLKTVENKIWKLATGYRKDRQYQPHRRTDPRPVKANHLNQREVHILHLGHTTGQEITEDRPIAVDVEHLARVINRPVAVVERYFRLKQKEGFLS